MTAAKMIEILQHLPPEEEIYMEVGECCDVYPIKQFHRQDGKVLVSDDDYFEEHWSRNRPDLLETVIK